MVQAISILPYVMVTLQVALPLILLTVKYSIPTHIWYILSLIIYPTFVIIIYISQLIARDK